MFASAMTESDVKGVIAWGSISYAFGFVIVMLHTWRLGLPVLDVLSAIYIWVGLPLAAVAFLSAWLIKLFKMRALARTANIKAAWAELKSPVSTGDLDVLATTFGVLASAVPFVGLLQGPLTALIRQASAGEGKPGQKNLRLFRRLIAISQGTVAIQGIMNLVAIGLALVLGIYLYVWQLYPQIPQGLGGGRPKAVRLLVLVEKASAVLPDLLIQQGAVDAAKDKTLVTARLTLLYMTKDYLFVENASGLRLSLRSDAVGGVIWNPQ